MRRRQEGKVRMKHAIAVILMTAALCAAQAGATTPRPPKAYLVAEVTVTDPAAYQVYAKQALPAITACGGTYLARGGALEALEGTPPAPRFVIVEFASLEQARACYASPAYQAIAPIRQRASQSRFWITEGLPHP
jgi:uncharacterized protein (DUF1330 family)